MLMGFATSMHQILETRMCGVSMSRYCLCKERLGLPCARLQCPHHRALLSCLAKPREQQEVEFQKGTKAAEKEEPKEGASTEGSRGRRSRRAEGAEEVKSEEVKVRLLKGVGRCFKFLLCSSVSDHLYSVFFPSSITGGVREELIG